MKLSLRQLIWDVERALAVEELDTKQFSSLWSARKTPRTKCST